MSNLKQASENIKRLAVIFKSLTDLAEMIDQVDSLENHVDELKAAKGALIDENTKLVQVKEDLGAHIVELKATAKEAQGVLDALKVLAQANEMEAEAKLKDWVFVKQAEAMTAIEKDQKAFDEEFKLAKAKLEKVEVELKEKSIKLEEVKKALEEIKGGI